MFSHCYKCLKFGIPKTHHTCARTKDDVYHFDEVLFHRIEPDEGIPLRIPNVKKPGEMKINPGVFKHVNRMSVNRSKYSSRNQVLYNDKDGKHFLDWAILKLPNSAVSKFSAQHPSYLDKKKPKKKTYSLETHHDPTDCNYAHCEIRTFETDSGNAVWCEEQNSLNRTVRKKIEEFYSDEFVVVKERGLDSNLELELEKINIFAGRANSIFSWLKSLFKKEAKHNPTNQCVTPNQPL